MLANIDFVIVALCAPTLHLTEEVTITYLVLAPVDVRIAALCAPTLDATVN